MILYPTMLATLKTEIDTLLYGLCDDYQTTREKLASSAVGQSARTSR